jgi:hypothetical protein
LKRTWARKGSTEEHFNFAQFGLAEIMIESIGDFNCAAKLKPIFDSIWNAVGFSD